MAPETGTATEKRPQRAWEALTPGLSEWVLEAIAAMGCGAKMTPVQSSTIPLFMGHKDVVVEVWPRNAAKMTQLIPPRQSQVPARRWHS